MEITSLSVRIAYLRNTPPPWDSTVVVVVVSRRIHIGNSTLVGKGLGFVGLNFYQNLVEMVKQGCLSNLFFLSSIIFAGFSE